MRNINELIGIIKGINFDGVINEREVEDLKSWVYKNRNLVYESAQVELVKIVDDVLEDNVITDKERELLLSYSEKYIKSEGETTSRIYELNGIIEGIVCDGEVNKQEIYRLQDWMNRYGDYIKDHKPSKAIYDIVEDILSDGIVTEAEQEELLQVLSKRINSSQFETKMAYLRKLVKERKNIGIDLIDILDNDEAMGEIHEGAEEQLAIALNSYSGTFTSDPEVVFVSLCLIGMLEYDGTYYKSVRKTYVNLYRRYSMQRVEGLIRTLLNRYRLNKDKQNGKARIINAVLSNSIVPSYFLEPFFEFIYDIYKLNFEYDLPEDLYEEFKFVFEGLRSSMMAEGDNLQINVTKKSYKLIQTTKNLITSGTYLDPVIKLSILVVKLIDNRIWNKEVKLYNPYLKSGYDKWIKTLDASEGSGKQAHSELRSRWESKYLLSNNEVYIVPPVHKVKATYNYRNIHIVVLNRDKLIYENDKPTIREIIGGYQVSVDRIKLEEPLGNITYRLMDGKRIIYDSKDHLKRKFIVFNTEGAEILNNTDYKGTAVICYNKDYEQLKSFYKNKKYYLAAKNVSYGDYVLFDDVVFNFSSLMKPGIFGTAYDNQYLVERGTQEKIQVLKQVKYLLFETEKKNTNIEIVVNSQAYRLSDFHYSITTREGGCKYVVDLKMDTPGVYRFVVNQLSAGSRTRIANFKIALDFTFELDTRKLNDETYAISINTSLSDGIISRNIFIPEFAEEEIKISCDGKEYAYYIPFDFSIYRISDSNWKPMSDELWIGDIVQGSTLDIYDAEIDEILVYSCIGRALETIKMREKGVYRQVNIGFLVSYKNDYDYTVLTFLKDGKIKKAMFCNNKCIMKDDTEILFDTVKRELCITPSYYGNGRVYFEIHNEAGDSVYKSECLENGNTISVTGLESYQKYMIDFYEKGKGLSLKNSNRKMKSFEEVFYAREDLLGKAFVIQTIYYVERNGQQGLSYPPHTYLHLIGLNSTGGFKGEIFVGYKDNLRSNLVKPIDVEMCSEVINGNMEVSISKLEKSLYVETDRDKIVEIQGNEGKTIESLTIKMNGVR